MISNRTGNNKKGKQFMIPCDGMQFSFSNGNLILLSSQFFTPSNTPNTLGTGVCLSIRNGDWHMLRY